MTSPYITTVLPPIRNPARFHRRRGSIREISRSYFNVEFLWVLAAEFVIFLILTAVTFWPMLNAAIALRALLL
ncbi:MAG TPA: hypothetical protein VGH08_00570 [Chthoniobacterales bacterium]|jgi:hypothetical protein